MGRDLQLLKVFFIKSHTHTHTHSFSPSKYFYPTRTIVPFAAEETTQRG